MVPIEFYYGLAIGTLSGIVVTFVCLFFIAGAYAGRKDKDGDV